jgi:probable phosphoglycerate mutase
MRILLIRHGETPLNVARVLQPIETPLSVRGVEQATALARRLMRIELAAIVSSDLARAWHTAELIAAATGAPLEANELLRERNFGDWRGQPYERLPENPLTMSGAPPGGESASVFELRIAHAFASIVRRAAKLGDTGATALAVVTHGLVIQELLKTYIQLPDGAEMPPHLGNTSLTIFDAKPPHLASLVNGTGHLDVPGGPRDDPNALSGG